MVGRCRRLLPLVVALMFAVSGPVFSQEITLNSADGSIRLTGELLEFDGESYRIVSKFGELTVNALGVTCTGLSCPDPGQYAADITISGTVSIVDNLLPGLIEDFGFLTGQTVLRQDHGPLGWTYFLSDVAQIPLARLQATPVNSSQVFADLMNEASDLAVSNRPPNQEEVQAAKKAGIGDLSSPVLSQVLAIGGLIFIVSKQNPISAITLDQAARIYAGEITNWAELGGYDGPIHLFSHEIGSDQAHEFDQRIFPESRNSTPASIAYFKSDVAISTAVSVDPFAIGYVGYAGIRNAKPLAIKGTCGIQQLPTAFTLGSDDYPLTRAYYVFTPDRRLPIFARNFLGFLDSDAAQTSIASLGFVGQGLTSLPFYKQQDRAGNAIAHSGDEVTLPELQDFVGKFADAERLSSTFRFADGTTHMDLRSKRNIRVLAQMIEVGDFDGKKLIFAAFSDTQGSASGNRRISRQRAEQVAQMVKTAANRADFGKVEIQTLGMGEVSPLACNEDEAGRKTNRRVEVWVK
ncbi:MAG: phosphate transport system substrate-binding protein [Paracoccaceae bacterium]|jgi:phosphate transport system substrate-binding protein